MSNYNIRFCGERENIHACLLKKASIWRNAEIIIMPLICFVFVHSVSRPIFREVDMP